MSICEIVKKVSKYYFMNNISKPKFCSLKMEQFSKERKSDNIQSFFSLQSTKREKSDILLISTEASFSIR
jgi:hypothetical protein